MSGQHEENARVYGQDIVTQKTPIRVELTREDPLVRKILEDRRAVTDTKPKPTSLL